MLFNIATNATAEGGSGMLDAFKELTGVIKEVAQTKKDLDQHNANSQNSQQQYQQQTQQYQQPAQQQYPNATGYDAQAQQYQAYTPPVDSSQSFQVGDVLVSKIGNVKVYKLADSKSAKVAQLGKAANLVFTGEEQNGYCRVKTEKGDGWVEKIMVKKQ